MVEGRVGDILVTPTEGNVMFNRLDDSARRAIVLAQEEAIACCAEEIGTGHLLYALAAPETGARAVLSALGVTPEAIREKLAKGEIKLGRPTPLSANLKRVLVAGERSSALAETIEKPVDMLGAIVDLGEGTAVEILYELGLSLGDVREMLTRYGQGVGRALGVSTVGA